MPDYSLNL